MKNVFILLVIILSCAVLVTGKIHWNNKIEAQTNAQSEVKADEVENKSANAIDESPVDKDEIMTLTKNLPGDLVNKIESAIETGEPLHFVLFGSASTSTEPTGWASLFKDKLQEAYGEGLFTVSIKSISNKNSNAVVSEGLYKEVIELKPDVLLFEPFILYDNGLVEMNNRLENLTTILNDFYSSLPELTVFIQPSYPLPNAVHYPKEVGELKRYAEANDYHYLDHWTAWPDHQTAEITEYVSGEPVSPTEKGHETWATYLSNYFISSN